MAKSSNKNAAQQEEKTIFIPAQSAQTNSKTNQANQSAPTATSAHPAQSSQGAKATGDKTIYNPAFTNRSSSSYKTKKNWIDRAANSVISYDQGGRVNAWQTALNVINDSSEFKNTKTKALSNQKYSDRFNSDVLNEYKARGGKTIFGMATNADLYKQIEDELTPNYAPAQTSYERAKIPQDITKEGTVANAIPAWFLATNYDVPTASIASSRTRGNALDYLQKYEDMSFGKKVLSVPGNTVANYGLDLANTELTGVNAMSGGKLGNGELGKASTIYSALNFAQNAGSGLTEQAFNSMLETSNWFEKIILQLEKTAIEQILDLTVGAATGGAGNLVMMGARVFGAGAQEAEDKGKSVGEQVLTGGIRSGIEIGTELLGGVGGSWRGTGYGDAVFDSLDKWVSTKTNKEMLGTLASAFGSEATEEMLSDVLNPLADRIFNISDGDQTFWQEVWGDGQLLYDGLLGGLAGLGGGLGTSISDASTAKYFGVDVATYKAAQRIAGNKKLREKYEQYTGEHLEEDEQTATMQIAIGLTDAASGKETSTRELENNIRNYKAPTPQNASEAPTTNASAPTSTDTTTAQNSAQTPTTRASAALGDMTAILNGNRVRVVGMTKMDNGQYAARIERATPQGTSQYDVTESKLTFDPETKSLLNMVRPYAYADEMLINYDAERNGGDKSLPAYVQAFNIVADILGKQSTLTEDEARAWVQNNKGLSATLSETQFEAAFRAGRDSKDAHVQNSATRQGGTGKLIFGKDVNYDGTQYKAATQDMISEAEREVLQTVAKAAGVDMFFYQSEAVDGKYQGANGFYRKGTVYLDVNAGANQTTEQSAVLLTAAHELTHYLRENNAEGYAELRDFVVTHLMQDGTDIEAMAEKMIRREGIYDGSFTLDDAVEEIVADSCEMMLQNTQLPQIMAQENPSLYAKVKDWLRRFVGNLRRAFEGVEARSPEARAMMQYAGELQQLWDNALADTAAKPREKRGESGNAKYSYAGRNARTANMEALAKAEELERSGEDWNTIRKETGWFKGMDNKWRFEINDSDMEFRKDGDVQLLAEPEYQQLIDLTDKWAASFDGGEALNEAEENEMSRLQEKYYDEVWDDKYMLRDFVKHDELFEAYPRLKDVGLQFDELPGGVNGFYSKRSNTIILDESLFGKEPDVVLHEIQHVIQKLEGFTGGSSIEHWNEQMENGYSKRGSHGSEMTPSELYRNTAGEIEARDTASRRKFTPEERRTNAPARANDDTVFADDERSYSIERTKDLTLKEQLKEYYAGKFKSSDSFFFGDTPTRLSAIGISNAPLTMTRKSFEKSTSKKHNIPRRVLKSLTDNLSNPVLAFYDGTTAGILIDDVDADGKPVLVAIDKNANMDRENVNNITSIYGLDNATAWLRNQTRAGKEFYVFDKKRADTFLQTYGYLATVGETNSSNGENISQSDAKVKTKYSNRERDTEYMEAVNAGDTETAQRLVDEAAADAGYSVHAYHGTPNGTFYVFNGWSYFTESKDYADVYQGQGASVNYKKTADNPKTYDVYIDPKNVFDTRNAREADIFWNEFYQKWGNGAPLSERGLPDWTDGDDFIEFFEENGYDYDTILLDEGGTGGYGEAVNDRGISYVVKDSSQVKSAEPITYDADGNVIPLSERFNASEPDIRYSRRSSDSEMTKEQTREQQMSRAELLRELEAQKQRTEYWRKQSQLTKEKTVRKTDTHKFARELAAQLDVKDTAAIAEFEDAAQYLGDYIVQSTSETMDYDTLHSIALDAADILLNNAEVEIESGMEEVRQDVFDYIKANKLKVNETEFKDMPEGWKRQHRRIRLSPDGVPIDVAWQQWQEQYGEGAFPSDITAQSDMLFYLADIERAWRPYKGNPFAENMGEMREAVAQEIIDTMLSEEIRQTAPTAMDRAKAKADKRYSEMKQAERQRANDRIAKVLAEGKARTREAVKAERTFQLQRVERTQKTKSIEKLRARMIKRLTDNTGKNHVPDILKEPVAQLLQSIDPTTTRTRQAGTAEYIKSLEKLQRVLENQRLHSQHNLDEDVKDATGADLYFDIPDGFAQQIQDYIEEVKHWGEFSKATTFKLEDMNLQELHDLENILKVVNGAVNRVNEMYTSNSTVSEISEGTIGYLDKMKPKTEATSGAEKFLGFTNQTPVYFFERMGETGAKIFKSFTDGWDKFSFYTEEILNFTKALYSREEVRAAERDIRTVQLHNVDNESGLTNENTVPVQMTRAQIMNLYAATVRGEQSINHILGGGIKLTNIKDEHGLNNPKNLLNDPKDILKKSKDIVQPDTYHLNMQELAQIISDNLTARDKEIVDKMIKFLSGPIAQWGNAVSQKRWGIDLFTEENYWPIGTDRNSRKVSNMDSAGNSASIYHLANMGFTKPLTPGANNPMIIGSAFDVFANHAADMAKYGSLVLPMLDAMKWINYSAITETGTETISLADGNEQTVERYSSKSVRKSMDRVYGHDAQDYFVRLMRDLNGSREGGRDAQNGLEKWSSRYKRQAVAANIRVMLLQPTSYIRAGNVLSLSGMAAGLNQFKVKQNYEEAIENSGIAKWKDLGFYDTNINASMRTQIKHDESTGDQIVDWTMKGAEMGDKWTWSMLWGASKHEVESKAKRAGETLTHDELMQRTNDLFTEVIYKTQVVDSPLTRSQLMRSDDKLNRTLTSFMAEPTLTYNVLAENVNEWQREASANGRAAANKKYGGKILRNMMVYCAGSIVSAAVESVIDAVRDDEEYMSFWDKYKEKLLGEDNFMDGNLASELNPLSKLPIVKDLVGIVSGDSSTDMSLEGFENAYSFITQLNRKIKYLLGDPDAEDIKLTDWGLAYQGLKAISQLSGIPGSTATRDVIGLWNTVFAPITGDYIHTYKQNPESNIKRAFLNGYVDEDEAMALLMDKETMGDKVYFTERAAKVKIADWTTGGVDKMYDELYTAMENDDRAAFDSAMNALTQDGMRYRYDVISNVRSTIKEWYTGDEHGATKLNKDMAEKMLVEYGGYTTHDAHTTVHQLTCKKVEGFSYTQRKELFLSGDLSYDEAVDIVQTYGKDSKGKLLYEYKDKSDARKIAEKEVREWQMALDTNIDYDNIRNAYDSGEISDAQLEQYLMKYGSMEEESAENKAYLWKWKEGAEELGSITGAQAHRYDDYIVGAGVDMSKAQYAEYIDGHLAGSFSGDLKPGSKTSYVPYSKRNKIWAYINSLPLTPEEKDAMAVVYAYDNNPDVSANSSYFDFQDAPWNN